MATDRSRTYLAPEATRLGPIVGTLLPGLPPPYCLLHIRLPQYKSSRRVSATSYEK